tara:strand:+ start:3433 stop:4035 length:603 start_codon:yes stop_codon:yes gene_type:complete
VLELLDNLLVAAYLVPTIIGFILVSPAGEALTASLSERFKILSTERGRVTAGLQIITFFGFAVSAQTFWISSKISEGGDFCSSSTVFNCDDLIGNTDLNVDPIFGLSWGMIGMITFAFLLFMVLVIKNEPNGEYTERFINLGSIITGAGILVILLLVSYEIQESKICLYCTTAHIANIAALVGFLRLRKLYDDKSAWKAK